MRKLTILKAIVDFFWIVTLPTIPIILFVIPALYFYDFDMPIIMNGIEVKIIDIPSKVVVTCVLISFLMMLYCVYLFRKMLRYFQNLKIFDEYVISAFYKMGLLFTISAFLSGIPTFIYRMFYLNEFKLHIGFSPFLVILSVGLFLMILSEVFKIAKSAKQDSELTI